MNAGVFWRARSAASNAEREGALTQETTRPVVCWNPEKFATEQLRSLVRRVFSPNVTPSVRQIVLSAAESETAVWDIFRRLGDVLAAETVADVAVVGDWVESDCRKTEPYRCSEYRGIPLRQSGTQLRRNLWTLPLTVSGAAGSTISPHTHLGEVRREFEYSIVAAAPCSESNEAIVTAQFADGLILVLSAQYTRRIAALRIREAIESSRVRFLGTVLRDREFPIPEIIYRRL